MDESTIKVVNSVFDRMDDDGKINQMDDAKRLTWCEVDTFVKTLGIDWNFSGDKPSQLFFYDVTDKEDLMKQDLEQLFELILGDRQCM